MCTSFVYRKEKVLMGMNFDNDGKGVLLSTYMGNDFLVSVNVNKTFYPSFGINKAGTFINDLFVDSNGEGKYKRQNEKRWLTTTVVKHVMENQISTGDLHQRLQKIEVVNGPFFSTHNLVIDNDGNILLIEPGRKNRLSNSIESPFYTMTNFPLSEYSDIQPLDVEGSGADRYLKVNQILQKTTGMLSVKAGFEILKSVSQNTPEWKTEISLIYDPADKKVFLCLNMDYLNIFEYDLLTEKITLQREETSILTLSKKGIGIRKLEQLI